MSEFINQDFQNPEVSFLTPFQSGASKCYPILPKNYYNTKGGKSKAKKSKSKSKQKGGNSCGPKSTYTNGMSCEGVPTVDLDLKSNFGPYLYPPVPFRMSGGKSKSKSKKQKGGVHLVGPEYLNQNLIPSTSSKPSDLDYNGAYSATNPNWKNNVTFTGQSEVPEFANYNPSKRTGPNCSGNVGVAHATAMGGAMKKRGPGRPRKQKGGDETEGATFLPAQFYNPDAKFASSKTDMNTAYGKANPVSGSCRNLAAFPNSSGQQTGGKRGPGRPRKQKGGVETEGATFLPPQFYNPNAKIASSKTDMNTAYGRANPVSGSCRNLAAFPNSSGQQTGGAKKKGPGRPRKNTKSKTKKKKGPGRPKNTTASKKKSVKKKNEKKNKNKKKVVKKKCECPSKK